MLPELRQGMRKLGISQRFITVLTLTLILLRTGYGGAAGATPKLKSAAQGIARLSQGAPVNLGKKMGPLNYVKIETQKLTRARVVWVNWDYLRKAGIDVGNEELTPEIEKAILDAFGWGIRDPGEPAEAFSATETKNFYADRYGGDGLAGNMGSGRAASAGRIQIKGIGKTELVTTVGPSHSNGTAEMQEAIHEAIYGEVGQVLPYGANRVIAILDRGTTTTFPSGHVQTNALIVREDSVRPAHYMKNLWGRGPLMKSEDERTQQVLTYLLNGLPAPLQLKNQPVAMQIRGAVLAYADRLAEQFAAAYARKIYHGATSVSNIESSGRFIDYGTLTTLPDYAKVKMIEINDPFGDISEFKDILMNEFLQNIRANLPAELASQLPTDTQMANHFAKSYRQFHHREFLRLTGLSDKDIFKIESSADSWRLTDLMQQVAIDGAQSVLDPHETVARTKYNLNRIIVKMATAALEPQALITSISEEIGREGDQPLQRKLVSSYLKVVQDLNVDRSQMLARAQELNAEHPETFRWNLYKTVEQMVQNYKKTGGNLSIFKGTESVLQSYRAPALTIRSCESIFAK